MAREEQAAAVSAAHKPAKRSSSVSGLGLRLTSLNTSHLAITLKRDGKKWRNINKRRKLNKEGRQERRKGGNRGRNKESKNERKKEREKEGMKEKINRRDNLRFLYHKRNGTLA